MNFLKFFLSIAIFYVFIAKIEAQETKLFVISTYDYKEALAKDRNRPGKDSDKHPYDFLVATVDSKKNYTIEQVSGYHEGVLKTYKRRNTLLFVHGDGANMDELIPLMSQVPDLYNVNVILFAWPAQEIRGFFGIPNYNQAKKNASYVFDSFIHTINHIRNCDSVKQGNITLMFHSLGNLFARQYAHYIVNNINESVFFDNIILNAPAVISENHEIWTDALALKAKKNVFLNFNKNDRTLKATDFFIEHQDLLGKDIKTPYANNINYIDFSETLKAATSYNDSHTYFIDVVPYQNQKVKNYYHAIINGEIFNVNGDVVFCQDTLAPNIFEFKN